MSLRTTLLCILFLSAITLPIQAQQWQLVAPIRDDDRMGDMKMIDPVTGFMIDDQHGGIFSTRDGGAHWDRKANNFGAVGMPRALWMWDAQRGVIAANGGRIYRTNDGFDSFLPTVTITGVTIGNCTAIHFVNDTLGFVGTSTGKIFRTEDAGLTWALQNSGITAQLERFFFLDDQLGFAVAAQYILRSTDGGSTWEQLPTPELVNIKDLHFWDAQNGIGVGSVGVILRTVDGGDTWSTITSPTTYTMNDLEVQGNTLIACGALSRIIRSTDGGATWTVQTSDNRERYSISFTPAGVGLMGASGMVYRSVDMGATWSIVHVGTPNSLTRMSFANDQIGVVAGSTEGLRTTDGGRHWAASDVIGLGVHLRPDGAGSSGGGLGVNTHTGDFYATVQNGPTGSRPQVVIRCTHSFSPTTYIVAGGNLNGGFYRTTNGGSSWTYTPAGNPYDMFFPTETTGYAVGEGTSLYKTTDAGITWTDLGPLVSAGQVTVFFLDEQRGWTGLHRTTDGGQTWTIMSGTPQSTVAVFFTDADTGYAVASSGQTVRSVDGGITWDNNYISEVPNASFSDATFVDGTLIGVANGGDIFRAQVGCPQTAFVPAIQQVGSYLCTYTFGTAQWFLNGEPIPDGNDLCVEANAAGNYHVVVNEGPGCVSAPSAPVQVITTGLGTNTMEDLRITPNPATDVLRIQRNQGTAAEITVYDTQGRTVLRDRMTDTTHHLDVHALKPGIHVLRINTGNGLQSTRFVKE